MPNLALLSISLILLWNIEHVKTKKVAHTTGWEMNVFYQLVIIFASICIFLAFSGEYKNKPNLYSQKCLCFVLCLSKIFLWGCSRTVREKNCGRNMKCLPTQSQAVISAGDADIQCYIQLKIEWVRLLPNRTIVSGNVSSQTWGLLLFFWKEDFHSFRTFA